MAFDLNNIVRENIKLLTPYSSARAEYDGIGQIFLDANENSFGSPTSLQCNRYPDPQQTALKDRIARSFGVGREQIFIGNGSDEAIDLLIRVACNPGIDNIIICPPTYGMYEVIAAINDAAVKSANLTKEFLLDRKEIEKTIDANSKLIFLCSPNNPTGNSHSQEEILKVAKFFPGIVVVDEAYIHFSSNDSLVAAIQNVPNLVVLQTFSKAWGLAGVRVGLAFGNREIIDVLNKIKPPYNVGQIQQQLAQEALENQTAVAAMVAELKSERARLGGELERLAFVERVHPSDANFLLVRMADADKVYAFLIDRQIIVRNRGAVSLCEGCLRITVGTPDENRSLLGALDAYRACLESES